MRFPAWHLLALLFITACVSAATPPTQKQEIGTPPATATPLATTDPTRIPKQGDLIFVEFFGIT